MSFLLVQTDTPYSWLAAALELSKNLNLCCRLYDWYSPTCHTLLVFASLLIFRVRTGPRGLQVRFNAGLSWPQSNALDEMVSMASLSVIPLEMQLVTVLERSLQRFEQYQLHLSPSLAGLHKPSLSNRIARYPNVEINFCNNYLPKLICVKGS